MSKRTTIFKLAIIVIPIAFLLLVELGLRLFNIAGQPPLFLEQIVDSTAYMQINSKVGERYFDKRNTPVPNLYPQKFSPTKGDNTYRIFCMGGSTTAGFPYEMTVPFPRQLKMLLQANYPDRDFEVINMGLSAVNSFTMVDWMPEILDQDPDLILLYMGHNEFYGAYGTGSTISLGNDGRLVRLILKLKRLHLYQLVESLVQNFQGSTPATNDQTLMEKVIGEKVIDSNSLLRIKTRENYATNLDIILKACEAAGVEIILSNLVSNIKDQPPLDVTSNPQQKTSKAYGLYQRGKQQFAQGDTATAYISLVRARNTDQVPFRGNDYINEIINLKSSQHRVTLVDMKKAFRKASPSTIPGSELFCDHLHPNPLGYHIMAREFQSAIVRSGLLHRVEETQLPLQPFLVSDLDWEIGGLKIFKLLHRWPFGNKQVNYSDYQPFSNQATADIAQDYLFSHSIWGKAHSQMADHFLEKEEYALACREYQAIIEIYPENVEFYTKLVESAKQAKLYDLVEQTCEKALLISSEQGMFHYNLAIAKRLAGEMTEAMAHIKAALEAPELTRIQAANVHFTYARFLIDLRKPSEAAAILTQLVKEVPEFTKAQELLYRLIN